MDKAIDKDLYVKVKEKAKEKFDRYPSAYASMWIQKEYQRLGGKYYGKKNTKNLNRWVKEKWIQVLPLLQNGEIIECGADNKDTKVCRPIVKVDKNTPITIKELLEIHSVNDLIRLAEQKNKNMNGRVYWKTLKFIE